MSKPKLPAEKLRISISISLSPTAVAILDRYVRDGRAETRSRAAEIAILELYASEPEPIRPGSRPSRARRA